MTSLVDAVRAAQDGNPLRNPVTVLCMPGARDAVMDALSQAGVAVGVKVQSLQMFVSSQFPGMVDAAEVAALVIQALQHLPEDSEIRKRGLAAEPATRAGVRAAVWQLLHAPREQWGLTGARTLPREIAAVTERIAQRLNDAAGPARVLPYEAWEKATAPERTIVWDVVGLNAVEDRLLERLPEPLRPAGTAQVTRMEVADDHTQALAVLTGVQEQMRNAPAPQEAIHGVGVALMNQAFGPVLADAVADLPLVAITPECLLDDAAVATLVGLLSLDVDTLPRAELAEVLLHGRIGWRNAAGKTPTIFGFDALSRRTDGPRRWPRWREFAGERVVEGTAYPARVEAEWVVALRGDLLGLRASESWSQWAARAKQLAKEHVNGAVPEALFERLAQFDSLGIEFTVLAAQEALREAAEATPLRPEEAFPAGLQAGPLARFAGGDLSLLLVCNASSVFMPHGVAEPAGVAFSQLGTSVERESRRQRELVDAALRGADEVRFIHAAQLSGGEFGGDPSRWIPAEATTIVGAEASDFALANRRNLSFYNALCGAWTAGTQQTVDVLEARGVGDPNNEFNGFVEGLDQWIAGHEFSASALNEYVKSPYLFFLQYVARMRELEADPAEDLDPRDKGTIFHAIVEEWTRKVWLDAPERPLCYEDVDWEAAQALLAEIVQAKLAAPLLVEISALSRHTFELRLQRGLADWFLEEKKRAQEGWVPLAVELDFGREAQSGIEVNLTSALGPISLRGFIDRVDYHPETGTVRVVDYKTGRNHFGKADALDWEDALAFTVQPDFYGRAMWHAIGLGTLLPLFEKAGLHVDADDINATIDVDFYFVFADKPEERHQFSTYGPERDALFQSFLGETLDMMSRGVFYPREIDTDRFLPTVLLRLGANNYARQAGAISDYLFQQYAGLNPAEEDADGDEDQAKNEGEN